MVQASIHTSKAKNRDNIDMEKGEDVKATKMESTSTRQDISISDILRNERGSSRPRKGDVSSVSAKTVTNGETIARPSKTGYSSIDFASILESVSSIVIPDEKSAKLERIDYEEKMKRISDSLSSDASARLQELMASATMSDGWNDPEKLIINKLLENHKKNKNNAKMDEEKLPVSGDTQKKTRKTLKNGETQQHASSSLGGRKN